MRRIVSASVAVLLFLGLTPLAGFAASIVPKPAITANPSMIFVQGWWEREHREQLAKDTGACRLRNSTIIIASSKR